MKRDKLKLLIKNLEVLLEEIKAEVYVIKMHTFQRILNLDSDTTVEMTTTVTQIDYECKISECYSCCGAHPGIHC